MTDHLHQLVQAAVAAASSGRWQEAEALWQRVRAIDPAHPQALYSLGVHAWQRGDLEAAETWLRAARQAAPRDPMIPLSLGVVHRARGDAALEWQDIVAALEIDPYSLPGLLAKAEFLERQQRTRAAAAVFRDVLKVVPAEAQWPDALRARLVHAREAVSRDIDELEDFLRRKLGAKRDTAALAQRQQWREAASILSGRTRPYRSECNQLHVPRLPAITFYDEGLFPWIGEFEARAADIRNELEQLIAEGQEGFVPYVAYEPGTPVNQWHELNHSRAWSSYHLWAHGQPSSVNLRRCPMTADALALVDQVTIAGLCPNAMFSALAPHTHIPPHTGETNARLVAHLPLVVPPRCSLRVGYDWRGWEPGKILVFDDSIEHEARNDSDELRVVLIFDVWNPLLSPEDREMVGVLADAMREYLIQA